MSSAQKQAIATKQHAWSSLRELPRYAALRTRLEMPWAGGCVVLFTLWCCDSRGRLVVMRVLGHLFLLRAVLLLMI
jgi:hypothetical protein